MKAQIRLFVELFLMMVIIVILTSMIFTLDYGFSYLWNEQKFLLAARFMIVFLAAGALAYFETVNITKVFRLLSGAVKRIRHTSFRERVYVGEDYLFADLIDDLNGFLDDMSDKLHIIQEDLVQAEKALDKGDCEKARAFVSELRSLFNPPPEDR
ncbi:MAG TPA: hypothetical protein PLW26_03890 [Candidatus Mcinerneyibacteriales bacterium]|nr:hypothetical protein [Candidatus Mcinerneyibacteriales bacterium]